MEITELGIWAVERGWVPDALTRGAIRRLCRERLESLRSDCEGSEERFVASLATQPIAVSTEQANEQHYEVPAEFFAEVLGPRRKYSCCFWPESVKNLAEAEAASLEITCQRAELADGQAILELGCGWGSLTLWMAERYPQARITAVSNSQSQRAFIEQRAEQQGFRNLRVITADMNEFAPPGDAGDGGKFDRVVSVEMFEHMRNYEKLLGRIASWLKPGGSLFVHIFCHREHTYPFEAEGTSNWMGRHFFTGGVMASETLLRRFDRDLRVVSQWSWGGVHYQRTADAWLANLDARKAEIEPILKATYGNDGASVWLNRWRVFFLAVSELFGYQGGKEWYVSHLLLKPVR